MTTQSKALTSVLVLSALLVQGCQSSQGVLSKLPFDVSAVTNSISSSLSNEDVKKLASEELLLIDSTINGSFGFKLGDKLDVSQCLEKPVENECKVSTQGNEYFDTAVVAYVPSTMQIAEIAGIHDSTVGEDSRKRPPFKHYFHGSVYWGHNFINACRDQANFAKEGLASKGISDSAFNPISFNKGKLAHEFVLLSGHEYQLQLYCHPGDLRHSSSANTVINGNEDVRSVQYVFSYIAPQLKAQAHRELMQKEEIAKQKAQALEELKQQKREEELKRKAASAF